jgi:uncharacterized membrane protein
MHLIFSFSLPSILTPFNLLLSATLLLICHKEYNRHFLIFIVIVFISGFLIELAGVRSGAIFGHYWYGETLGLKLFGIPLIIGVNWVMLMYLAGVLSNHSRGNIFVKSLIGGIFPVALDILIEQKAQYFDFWLWLDGYIPLQNYIAWYLISVVFLILFHSLNFNKESRLAPVLYLIQLMFFALLWLL